MCRRQTLTPLSPAERSVAEQHYRLVEWYVRHRGLPVDEYLDVAVFGYLLAVKRSFDFSPVHMAMVNGQNGVGKSSLFMDAIADCLYEQTRKEDIGGWVRDGTKSGSITFTFALGGQDYRVIRTRTKSGRGTLALQRWNPEGDAWADESDTTMKLTQARIERLLGMDCNTFCSIALIRQDAYGLFLDADSDRRMEVLSALLALPWASASRSPRPEGMKASPATLCPQATSKGE